MANKEKTARARDDNKDRAIKSEANQVPDTGGKSESGSEATRASGKPDVDIATERSAESANVEPRMSAVSGPADVAADQSQNFQRIEALIEGLSAISRAQLDATQRLVPSIQQLSERVAMSNATTSTTPASFATSASSIDPVNQQLHAAAAVLPPQMALPSAPVPDPRVPASSPCSCDETCPECQCVSACCCCFNIVLHRIRVTSLGGLAGVVGEGGVKLELQIYAYVPGIGGVLYPSLGGHVMVQGKLGGPGSWVSAGVIITKVCILKGQTKPIPLNLELKENDKIFKDDIGSGSLNISLNCCFNDMNIITHEVQLTQGDGGKAIIGMEFRVEKVC